MANNHRKHRLLFVALVSCWLCACGMMLTGFAAAGPEMHSGEVLVLTALADGGGKAPQEKSAGALADRVRGMNPEERIQYLMNAKDSGKDTPELHFLLGVALYSSGLVDSSEAFFRRAIDMDSTYTRAYVNLGIVLDTKNKSVEAEFMYKKALELNPDDELANCHLGFIYHTRGQHDKAVQYYLDALAVNPNSAQAHYNLGLAFADARIFKEALQEWEKVIELEPDGALGQTAKENVELIKQYMEADIK